jgi:hypothetical protein
MINAADRLDVEGGTLGLLAFEFAEALGSKTYHRDLLRPERTELSKPRASQGEHSEH